MRILKKISPLALLLCFAFNARAEGNVLAQFDLNNYEGWTYTRDVELTTAYIGANKVKLFKTSGGKNYTLISPEFNCQGMKAVRAKFNWILTTIDDGKFSLTKASPYVELIDANNTVVAQQHIMLKKAVITQELSAVLDIPEGATSLRLRLAAWDADTNSPGAVSQVTVKPFLKGDVDDDGVVGITDVTWLINACLGTTTIPIELGDMSGDGELTIVDVTLLINSILKQ